MMQGREYQLVVGAEFMALWDALMKVQFNPSEENKAVLKKLEDENTKSLQLSQAKKEAEFVIEHDLSTLEFIRSISTGYFLVGKSVPFALTWDIKYDENDDYWEVSFYKGEFFYRKQICGGYAGTDILEKRISKERVMELLNSR